MKLTLHYQSPANDPYKVPRPHRVTVPDDGPQIIVGGEIGPLRHLLGFCPTTTPDVDDWQLTDPTEAAADPAAVAGWYAQFTDADGSMFGYDIPIRELVVE